MEQKPKTLLEAVKAYADADSALTEAADSRWPKGVACAHCGAENTMFLKTRRIWKCSKCRKQFSFKAGTVFEDSAIGLDKWLPAVWMIANDRNGISSHELARTVGVTQKTAWFMLHRIRLAMQDGRNGGKLGGEVEVDETFIGGKARNMHKSRKAKIMGWKTGGTVGKTAVQGLLERHGKVTAKVVGEAKRKALSENVKENVEPGSTVYTDEAVAYYHTLTEYDHQVINHAEAYVNGNIHTNGIENFWSCLKRGIGGTYVAVEPFHLFRYVDEQAFRYNNRKDAEGNIISDYDRFKAALSQVTGRRLTYQQLIGKEGETEAF
jgi:transposase-like protein